MNNSLTFKDCRKAFLQGFLSCFLGSGGIGGVVILISQHGKAPDILDAAEIIVGASIVAGIASVHNRLAPSPVAPDQAVK